VIKPIFLLSLPRSGSTLVQRVLAAHEGIATAAEPWLLLPHGYALRETGIAADYTQPLAARAIREFVGQLPAGEDDYWASLRNFALDLYSKAAGEEVTYFLDKTPRYHFVAPELFRMFPDAKIIFLWRNPLAVVSSIVGTWTKGKWNVDRWQGDLRGVEALVEAYEAHRDTSLAVNYETLVGDPDRTWPAIFEYLELPFDPSLLTSFSDVTLEGKMGDPTGKHHYRELSTEPLLKWKGTLGTPWRKRWCRSYLDWIGPERLATMGYDASELRAELDALPSSPRHLASDAMHGTYWTWAQRSKRAAFRRMTPRVR
jgi:hypothetical protein